MEAGAKEFSGMVYFSARQGCNQCEKNDSKNVETLHLRRRMGTTDIQNLNDWLKKTGQSKQIHNFSAKYKNQTNYWSALPKYRFAAIGKKSF